MPIYDYRCTNCNSNYDVLHKGKEIIENIVCPSCGSMEYKKLFSTVSISMKNSSVSCESGNCPMPSSYRGGCNSGMCGIE